MRTTRPTVDLNRARHFYQAIVGLPVLWDFVDHDGFDGVIFGLPDERTQLELVDAADRITPQPTAEDALVLYCDVSTADAIAGGLRGAGVAEVDPDAPDLNPYWPRTGAATFVDPDGYRLIIAIG